MTKTKEINETRRSFLKGGGALAVAGAGVATLATPAVVTAQAPIVLRMQSSWTSGEIFQEMARQYVERVEAMSGGRLRIELLPAGAVVGAFQVMEATSDGILDACHQVPVYWYGLHAGASLFGTGPVWGGSATNLLSWIHRGGGQELYDELVHDILRLNVVGFFGFPMPAQPFGWFKNPVNTVADVNGLRYRTVGLAADLMQQMGMSVTQLPGGEIVPAMERGVIDAFEFNNPSADRRFGAQDVAKNYMLSSYHQASECFEINFNRDVWEDLDPDLQAILKYGVDASATSNTALALDQYSTDLAALRDEHGVTLLRTPSEVLARQIEAWDALIPNLEQDDFIRRAMDSQRAWTERTVFYQLMNDPDYKLAYDHYFPGRLPF
ncbi:MAG: TRAP transporter substrate-binding protein [Bauldia sp.]|nr:TRAP transporter substrate-binding protein [Bauldia sp.]MCW5717697.1 TRAP transporter substrate-binding protein [Bauldia sp.]